LSELREKPTGTIRITTGEHAAQAILWPTVSKLLRAYPDIHVEIIVDYGLTDIVTERYDAGVRLTEAIQRDMVQVRLTDAFRFVVVGSPDYLARHGTPERPEDLLRHECITFRSPTTGQLSAWELERGRRSYRVPVRGATITNDSQISIALAEAGLGLAYASEGTVLESLKARLPVTAG